MTEMANRSVSISRSGASDIRILLIGQLDLFLAALQALIQRESGLTVVGTANWTEAVNGSGAEDVILMDIGYGDEPSLNIVTTLCQDRRARLLALTEADDPDLHLRVVSLGAMGAVKKAESPHNLFHAIRKIHGGGVWLNSALLNRFLQGKPARTEDPEAAKIAELTMRELEVISLICEGRKNKQIAERLFIAESTVRHHLESIFAKLGLQDRLELLLYAYQNGLNKPPSAGARFEMNIQRNIELVRRLSRSA
jgi:DNA-binding NarL/FixJ family response regulator